MHWEAATEITADASDVWVTLTDIARWPEWSETMTAVELLDSDGFAVDARARVTQPRLGPNVWQITEINPGHGFVWRSKRPGITTVATHVIRPLDDGRVVVTLGIDQSGALSLLLGRILGGLTARYLQTEAAGLKHRCEKA